MLLMLDVMIPLILYVMELQRTSGDCPPGLDSWISGCGKIKPHLNLTEDWVKEFIDFEIRERKYLVIVKETVYHSDIHSFPGVLLTERCAIALCANFRKNTLPKDREIIVTRPLTGEIRAYSTHSSFTPPRPCGFESNYLFNNPIVLELAMARGAPTTVVTDLEELPDYELCRYYSIPHENDGDPDAVGGFIALEFIARDPICQESENVQQNGICGSIFDPNMRFCSLLPGGSVFCNGSLLGIAQTGCIPGNMPLYANKTTFPLWVLTISSSEKKYWQSLGIDEQDDYFDHRGLLGRTWLNGANNISICFIICFTIFKYTFEHQLSIL